jgi:hypothetical protein
LTLSGKPSEIRRKTNHPRESLVKGKDIRVPHNGLVITAVAVEVESKHASTYLRLRLRLDLIVTVIPSMPHTNRMEPYTPRALTGGRKRNLTLSVKEYTKVSASSSVVGENLSFLVLGHWHYSICSKEQTFARRGRKL